MRLYIKDLHHSWKYSVTLGIYVYVRLHICKAFMLEIPISAQEGCICSRFVGKGLPITIR